MFSQTTPFTPMTIISETLDKFSKLLTSWQESLPLDTSLTKTVLSQIIRNLSFSKQIHGTSTTFSSHQSRHISVSGNCDLALLQSSIILDPDSGSNSSSSSSGNIIHPLSNHSHYHVNQYAEEDNLVSLKRLFIALDILEIVDLTRLLSDSDILILATLGIDCTRLYPNVHIIQRSTQYLLKRLSGVVFANWESILYSFTIQSASLLLDIFSLFISSTPTPPPALVAKLNSNGIVCSDIFSNTTPEMISYWTNHSLDSLLHAIHVAPRPWSDSKLSRRVITPLFTSVLCHCSLPTSPSFILAAKCLVSLWEMLPTQLFPQFQIFWHSIMLPIISSHLDTLSPIPSNSQYHPGLSSRNSKSPRNDDVKENFEYALSHISHMSHGNSTPDLPPQALPIDVFASQRKQRTPQSGAVSNRTSARTSTRTSPIHFRNASFNHLPSLDEKIRYQISLDTIRDSATMLAESRNPEFSSFSTFWQSNAPTLLGYNAENGTCDPSRKDSMWSPYSAVINYDPELSYDAFASIPGFLSRCTNHIHHENTINDNTNNNSANPSDIHNWRKSHTSILHKSLYYQKHLSDPTWTSTISMIKVDVNEVYQSTNILSTYLNPLNNSNIWPTHLTSSILELVSSLPLDTLFAHTDANIYSTDGVHDLFRILISSLWYLSIDSSCALTLESLLRKFSTVLTSRALTNTFQIDEYANNPGTSPPTPNVTSTSSIKSSIPLRKSLESKAHAFGGAFLFNIKPQFGIQYWQHFGILQPPETPDYYTELVFLLASLPGIDKTALGSYLGNVSQSKILTAYTKTFSWQNVDFLTAWREIITSIKFSGESQIVGRVMEAFGCEYHAQNPDHPHLHSGDACFVLAFALIMIHTDAHNSSITSKMTHPQFLKLVTSTDHFSDQDEHWITMLYDSMVSSQITTPPPDPYFEQLKYYFSSLYRIGHAYREFWTPVHFDPLVVDLIPDPKEIDKRLIIASTLWTSKILGLAKPNSWSVDPKSMLIDSCFAPLLEIDVIPQISWFPKIFSFYPFDTFSKMPHKSTPLDADSYDKYSCFALIFERISKPLLLTLFHRLSLHGYPQFLSKVNIPIQSMLNPDVAAHFMTLFSEYNSDKDGRKNKSVGTAFSPDSPLSSYPNASHKPPQHGKPKSLTNMTDIESIVTPPSPLPSPNTGQPTSNQLQTTDESQSKDQPYPQSITSYDPDGPGQLLKHCLSSLGVHSPWWSVPPGQLAYSYANTVLPRGTFNEIPLRPPSMINRHKKNSNYLYSLYSPRKFANFLAHSESSAQTVYMGTLFNILSSAFDITISLSQYTISEWILLSLWHLSGIVGPLVPYSALPWLTSNIYKLPSSEYDNPLTSTDPVNVHSKQVINTSPLSRFWKLFGTSLFNSEYLDTTLLLYFGSCSVARQCLEFALSLFSRHSYTLFNHCPDILDPFVYLFIRLWTTTIVRTPCFNPTVPLGNIPVDSSISFVYPKPSADTVLANYHHPFPVFHMDSRSSTYQLTYSTLWSFISEDVPPPISVVEHESHDFRESRDFRDSRELRPVFNVSSSAVAIVPIPYSTSSQIYLLPVSLNKAINFFDQTNSIFGTLWKIGLQRHDALIHTIVARKQLDRWNSRVVLNPKKKRSNSISSIESSQSSKESLDTDNTLHSSHLQTSDKTSGSGSGSKLSESHPPPAASASFGGWVASLFFGDEYGSSASVVDLQEIRNQDREWISSVSFDLDGFIEKVSNDPQRHQEMKFNVADVLRGYSHYPLIYPSTQQPEWKSYFPDSNLSVDTISSCESAIRMFVSEMQLSDYTKWFSTICSHPSLANGLHERLYDLMWESLETWKSSTSHIYLWEPSSQLDDTSNDVFDHIKSEHEHSMDTNMALNLKNHSTPNSDVSSIHTGQGIGTGTDIGTGRENISDKANELENDNIHVTTSKSTSTVQDTNSTPLEQSVEHGEGDIIQIPQISHPFALPPLTFLELATKNHIPSLLSRYGSFSMPSLPGYLYRDPLGIAVRCLFCAFAIQSNIDILKRIFLAHCGKLSPDYQPKFYGGKWGIPLAYMKSRLDETGTHLNSFELPELPAPMPALISTAIEVAAIYLEPSQYSSLLQWSLSLPLPSPVRDMVQKAISSTQ